MKALLIKELKSVFCSPAGAFFALAFLGISGVILWAFPGNLNIIDSGYAEMIRFFSLAPILLAILIPAITMRLFSEEKRNKTLDILRTRPISSFSIYFSKFFASLIFITAVILSTLIYVYSVYQLANPAGNIDIASIMASYISLLLLACVFITIGLFGSVITRNQIVALIISVFLCLFSFYGFEMLLSLFFSGKVQSFISSIGLLHHYKLMQRGVIQTSNLLVIANYLILFILAAIACLDRKGLRKSAYVISFAFILNILFIFIPNTRFDFTADKRYTLSPYSTDLLKKSSNHTWKVDIYLAGELNYGFQRLQDATRDIISDFNQHSANNIETDYITPYEAGKSPNDLYQLMAQKGMPGIFLNETDREGKVSRKVIYPYAQVSNDTDTLTISLLKNITGYTPEENLNASVENLEFEFIDAINLLSNRQSRSVAFIEGHKELERTYVYDAEELLSKYYSVNRGQIGNHVGILDSFDAIIIAGPLIKYTEEEKYILDQYIMQGGKVLWLVDGAYYSYEELAQKGYSASIKNEVNLDDMLFSYGVRINADFIQDKQSISSYMVSENDIHSSALIPNYFRPLLLPSPNHPVTKNIRDVMAGFSSSIDIINSSPEIVKDVLLTSSANAHLVKVPDKIDFIISEIQNTPGYFNIPFIPVAVSLQGSFTSVYKNRITPDSISLPNNYSTIANSQTTKMIVVSSSDIITNGVQGYGENTQILPMGYDRVSKQQYGNRDFILNAVNWLTGDDALMQLRTKKQQIYALNKKEALENRTHYSIINTVCPALFILLIMAVIYLYRKRKYES